jgi:hypothetical protein
MDDQRPMTLDEYRAVKAKALAAQEHAAWSSRQNPPWYEAQIEIERRLRSLEKAEAYMALSHFVQWVVLLLLALTVVLR